MKTKLTYKENLTLEKIDNALQMMSVEEAKEMTQKMNEVINLLTYPDSVARAMAKEMFRLGYIAAHFEKLPNNVTDIDFKIPAVESYD